MRYLVLAFLTGMIFGIGSIIMKVLTVNMEILNLLTNPIFLINSSAGILGFFLFQKSMIKEKASHSSLVCTSASTLIPIVGGLLLGELINIKEIVGIILIMSSVVILTLKG